MKLSISNLSLQLQKQSIVRCVSLDVKEGEFLSLLGPSGCGKSTLLKTVAGIYTPQSGEIRLDGQEITRVPPHKRGTVILFQDIRLFPHMQVWENVAFPLKVQGISLEQRKKTAEDLLEKVQLKGYGPRKPGSLSGGEQQRVALARALAAKPKLLMLDEPFSALDENLREDMRKLVLSLHREFGITTLLVTHDRQEALALSDRVALMFDGSLVQTGSPKEVYQQPANRQVADYFGDCVYIPGMIRSGIFSGSGLSAPINRADGPCALCLRPSAWELDPMGDFLLTVHSLRFEGTQTLVSFQGPQGISLEKRFTGEPDLLPGSQLRARVLPHQCIFFPKELNP